MIEFESGIKRRVPECVYKRNNEKIKYWMSIFLSHFAREIVSVCVSKRERKRERENIKRKREGERE
jgi:hypothetical protein